MTPPTNPRAWRTSARRARILYAIFCLAMLAAIAAAVATLFLGSHP